MGADWDQVIEFHLTIYLLDGSHLCTCTLCYGATVLFATTSAGIRIRKKVPQQPVHHAITAFMRKGSLWPQRVNYQVGGL